MSNYIIHNGELYHYGIPGMKWGVRKAKYAAKAEAYRKASLNSKNQVKSAKLNAKAEKMDQKAASLDTAKGRATYTVKKGAAITAGILAAGLGATAVYRLGKNTGDIEGYVKGFTEGADYGEKYIKDIYNKYTFGKSLDDFLNKKQAKYIKKTLPF